jgi:hypothetical protein
VVAPSSPGVGASGLAPGAPTVRLIVTWLWVGIPLAWGVSQTILQSLALFR